MAISAEVIKEIKSKAKIEDVIGQFITVMKKGNNYVAYCPFHDDHDPSLHISTDKQIFKCFSCPPQEHSAGDVFQFVSKFKHCSYYEAIEIVANMVGYKYDFSSGYKKSFVETITHKIMKDAVNFTMHELNGQEGIPYKEYLHLRNISDELIEKFCIGYNPSNDRLYNFLRKKGYQDKDIIEANVCRLTNNGLKDVFYNRITIPIFDPNSHPIAFTARSIDPNTDSKYINSTDTPVFNKGKALFNLNRAKDAIREKKFAIICEGPMDVIAFSKAGLDNAVCSLGTATTDFQLGLLKKITNRLLLAYDGDDAGQAAIWKTGQLAKKLKMNIMVINNQSQLDPDEIINKYGANELVAMIEKPIHWMDFILSYYQKDIDIANYSSKKDYVNKCLVEIGELTDDLDKDNYLQKLSTISGFNYNVLANSIKHSNSVSSTIELLTKKTVNSDSGTVIAMKTLISQMLLSPAAIEKYQMYLNQLPDDDYSTLAGYIINYYNQHNSVDVAEMINELDTDLSNILFSIASNEMYVNQYNEDLLNDSIINIQIYDIEMQAASLSEKINTVSDELVKAKYVGERTKLKLQIKELKDKLSGNKR